MHKKLSVGLLAVAGLVCASSMSGAATLDDVMARLESMQRDNQAIRADNAAMRKEISALRQQRSVALKPSTLAPAHQLSPTASSAMAADPATGRYAAPPQAFSWSGFYVGMHAGYGWGSNDWSMTRWFGQPTVSGSPLSNETNGVLGGIQAGANLQLDNWVLGIETDWAFINADSRSKGRLLENGVPIPGAFTTGRSQIDWLATFTGRVGYAVDRSLFYAKGGVAVAAYKDNMGFGFDTDFYDLGTKDSTRVGWTVGAGWEYAFATNWSAKIEYNYLDLGTTSEIFNVLSDSFEQEKIEHTLHIVKAGVNYRF